MANNLLDRVQVSVVGTPGSGTIVLGSAVAGWQDWATAGARDNAFYSYLILDTGNTWEFGKGQYQASGPNLIRVQVYASSSGGTAIGATSSATVACVPTAEDVTPVLNRPVNWNGAAFFP